MSYCTRCGKDLDESAQYCRFCGNQAIRSAADAPASDLPSMSNKCAWCGTDLKNDAQFCEACGKAVKQISDSRFAGVDTRCIKCGAVIRGGSAVCPSCGQPAISQTELADKHTVFMALKRYLGRLRTLIIIGAVIFLFLLLCSLGSPIEIIITAISMILIPYLIVVLILRRIWYKKLGWTHEKYQTVKTEYKSLPKNFFKPIPPLKVQKTAQTSQKTPKKNVRKRVLAIAGLAAAICIVCVVINFAVNGTDNILPGPSSSAHKTSQPGGGDVVGQTLSGRWQNMTYNKGKSGGLEEISVPVIVFKGNKAYFGVSANSNSDIISESSNSNGTITYEVSNGKITFTDKRGKTHSYTYKNGTIYYDDGQYKKVN